MNLPNIKVSVWPCKNKGKIVATAKITIGNAFAIYPFRLIQGRQRMYLGMPQLLDHLDEYRDVFYPVNAEARKALTEKVIHTYQNAKNSYWDFPAETEFMPDITVRLYSDPIHNLIGYAEIVINDAFRIVNIRIFQDADGHRRISFPERGYRENGEIVIKSIFEFRRDWEDTIKKRIGEEFDRVYEAMKKESIQKILGKKDGDLSYDEMMEIRLLKEAELRKAQATETACEEIEQEEFVIQ